MYSCCVWAWVNKNILSKPLCSILFICLFWYHGQNYGNVDKDDDGILSVVVGEGHKFQTISRFSTLVGHDVGFVVSFVDLGLLLRTYVN